MSRAPLPDRTGELNAEQRAFVEYLNGSAVLHASVGTGKTLALAERAARAIQQGVEPGRILCVTFTNRAAEEMRQRIYRRCGATGREVRVFTFHALCAWMLRCEAKRIGLPRDFTIFDEEDSKDLIAHVGRTLGIPRLRLREECEALARHIAQLKADAPREVLNPRGDAAPALRGLAADLREAALAYQRTLRAYHAVDFADLVLLARCMLFTLPDVRRAWEGRFAVVQVDEVQDTHLSEYEVISLLAKSSGNLVLAGDFDQTIYEWRGSRPDEILARFRSEYPKARWFSFSVNYRSTKVLLDIAASVASRFGRHAVPKPHAAAAPGEPAVVHFAEDELAEARWIARRIKRLHEREGVAYGRIAVLARKNERAQVISQQMLRAEVPHLTVEAYEFFRRQEIKDALAYLRFLANPWDEHSLRRLLARPARGIGPGTLERVQRAAATGLRLVDLVSEQALDDKDPLAPLLAAWEHGEIVVFDTETTGLDPGRDEIVELAAVKLRSGRPAGRFHKYLRNTVPVGESEAIHGFSDAFLAEHGEPAGEVLRAFLKFAGRGVLVGHNVGFDLRMLRAQARRLNVPLADFTWFDTLDLAQRFVDSDDYKLATLARRFGIQAARHHHAGSDVDVTCALLAELIRLARQSAPGRIQAVAALGENFRRLAAEVARFRRLLDERPPQLLAKVLQDSGLFEYYRRHDEQHGERRTANLRELHRIMLAWDRPDLGPRESLDAFLAWASLSRNVDRLDRDEDRVKVLTVHQAKGLEFDVVFVAGLSAGEFPIQRGGGTAWDEEELRIFYVAVTRARQRLILTGHAAARGRPRRPSPFLNFIGDGWTEEGSRALAR